MEDVLHNYSDDAPKYAGDTKNGRMEGKGTFHFPNGNVYIGEFLNNAFHGAGTIHFPGSGKYDATWTRGVASDGRYTFGDGLAYQGGDWDYCKDGDRRFYTERQQGINPAGRDQLTNSTDTSRVLPRGCFDVVDGYLNPDDGLVYDWKHEGQAIRPAAEKTRSDPSELDWAKANCRMGGAEAPIAVREDEVAAKKIQAMHRGKAARKVRSEEANAAVNVQAQFRGYQSRQSMKQRAMQAEQDEQAGAATKIAAMHRGKAARREAEQDRTAATKVQAIQRGRLARRGAPPAAVPIQKVAADSEVDYDPAEVDAATLIQSHMRGNQHRKDIAQQNQGAAIEKSLGLTGGEDETAAIAKIQAIQRGKQDRKQVAELKIEAGLGLTGSPEEAASIARMQAMQRGKMSRKELEEQKEAATKIAAIQRGKAGRKKAATMKGSSTAQSIEEQLGLTGSEREGAAIEKSLGLTGGEDETAAIAKIQAIQRGKAARREAEQDQTAATKVQAIQRGRLARRGAPPV